MSESKTPKPLDGKGHSEAAPNANAIGLDERKLFVDMAKMHDESAKNRQQYEWKLAFGFWTGIGVFTGFVVHEGIVLSSRDIVVLLFVYAILLVGTVVCILRPLHRGHTTDRDLKHWCMDRAEGGNRPRPNTRPEEKLSKWSPNTWLWFLGQLLFTAVFLFLSWAVIAIGKPNVRAPEPNVSQRLTVQEQADNK